MPAFRRHFLPGGTYFFTVTLADRRASLLIDHVDLLRTAFRYARRRHPFTIDAIAILPDHLHAIWSLPAGDADFATRWRLIKSAFSRSLPGGEPMSLSRSRRGERGIWQRRYWEHTIRDEDDLARHIDYIHFNPVKHGYVDHPAAWPFSSYARAVRLGHYPAKTISPPEGTANGFGERE